MKKHFLLSIIYIVFIGCGFSKISTNINSNAPINIEKQSICINEEVKISINNNDKNSTGKIYKIGDKTGNPAILVFSTPGNKTVSITINDVFHSKIEHKEVKIDVKDCHSENTILLKSYPEEFNLGILNFKTDVKASLIKKYKWDFGDGKSEFSYTPFIQHDYRTRIQKDLYSTFIISVTALGLDGKKYFGRTSISIPNINYLSKKLGTPTIPIRYNRFPEINNEKIIIDYTLNNIYEETFFIEEILIKFKNHGQETALKEFLFNSNDILKNVEVPGNQHSKSQLKIPTSIVPENSTRIYIQMRGTLNYQQETYTKLYIDLPPKNEKIANSQGFSKVKNQVLIRKLEQAEKFYGKGRPISTRELEMVEANHEN